MKYEEQLIKNIKDKTNGLQIYINVYESVLEHKVDDCSDNLKQFKEYQKILKRVTEYIDENLLNNNFLLYINSVISNLRFTYSGESNQFEKLNLHSAKSYYLNINERVKEGSLRRFKQLKFDLETIEKLHLYQNNILFIGANGAGKTTLANDLRKHFGTNCVGISAQRVLMIPKNSSILNIEDTRSQLKNIQNKDITNKHGGNISNEFTILLNNLFSENTVTSNTLKKQYQNNEDITAVKSILDEIIDLWNDLIDHRNLDSDGMNLTLSAKNIDKYDANLMSDGEKVILYIVGQILTAPKDGFIIIDEPELFLNKNILNKLWNKLEIIRDDCKFIYLTHDLDFAISRSASKYWIKSYTKDNFEFSEIENNEIPDMLVIELLGSQKNILFCEGKKDGKSYDIRILEILFPHFNIKAVESCSNVINYTKAFNNMNNVSIKAFGLIDSDFHPQARLDSLETENIYNFGFSEIENLCLEENLFKEFAKSISSKDTATDIMKEKVFWELEKQKVQQVSLHVTMRIDYHYKESHMNKSKTLEELNENFNSFNKPIEINTWYKNKISEIDKIICQKDYTEALKVFNNKGLIGKANESLDIKDYMERIIRYLSTSKNAQDHIKKYFHKDLLWNEIK